MASNDRPYLSRVPTNALTGAGTRIAMMLIGFSLTPFVVHSLGLQTFGILTLASSLCGYIGLLDFGLSGSFVKFITEYAESNNKTAVRQVVWFGVVFYSGYALLLALPVYLAAQSAVHLFRMPASDLHLAVRLFYAFFAILVLSMFLRIPAAVVVALHRMDLVSRNIFMGYLLYVGIVVYLLRDGWGVTGVVVAQVVQIVATALLQLLTARALFGPLWCNPMRFDPAIIRRLFSFGSWTQCSSFLYLSISNTGRVIAASVLGVTTLSYYEIGDKLSYFSQSLPGYLVNAMMPAATAAATRPEDRSLDRIFAVGTLCSVAATLGIGGFLTAANDLIMRAWMGQLLPSVAAVTLFLCLGYGMNSFVAVTATVFRALGLPRYETYYCGVTFMATLAGTVALAPRYGIVGIAAGTAVGSTVGSVFLTAVYQRVRGTLTWGALGSPLLRTALAAIVSALLLHLLVREMSATHAFQTRFAALSGLAAVGILYLIAYGGIALALGIGINDLAHPLRRLFFRSVGRVFHITIPVRYCD